VSASSTDYLEKDQEHLVDRADDAAMPFADALYRSNNNQCTEGERRTRIDDPLRLVLSYA
jgi:hypothetical protein